MAVISTEIIRTSSGGAFRLRTHTDGPGDRIQLTSQHDESPVYLGGYSADCSPCWLGYGHSEQKHAASIA